MSRHNEVSASFIQSSDPAKVVPGERFLTLTEARHYLNHDTLPRAEALGPPDKYSATGRPRWRISTLDKLVKEGRRVNWEKSKCDGKTELFFSALEQELDTAISLCKTCPLTRECARRVLAIPVRQAEFGIWAGTTPIDRKLWRRERNVKTNDPTAIEKEEDQEIP